jgi:GNAT superfamily N-acetyltransferase
VVAIRSLTPAELDDFLAFMDDSAFTTNPQWSGCYCQFYLNTEEQNTESRDQNRQRACDRIRSGTMSGYLAYEGNEVIGWVAANKANNFVLLPPTDEKTARILCFIVEQRHQGKGVSTELLTYAINDLASQGFTRLEAAPRSSDEFDLAGYRGKLSTFLKAGFEQGPQIDENHILVHRELTE